MRYLLFAGDYYYPAGGWKDFYGAFESLEEAEARVEIRDATGVDDPECEAEIARVYDVREWAHIVSLHTMQIVWQRSLPPRKCFQPPLDTNKRILVKKR
jgi:hypothetical protein